MRITVEKIIRIHNDDNGDFVEVCEDTDGLDMLVVKQGKQRLDLVPDQIDALISALTEVRDHIVARSSNAR
jgi:hypothetical protein